MDIYYEDGVNFSLSFPMGISAVDLLKKLKDVDEILDIGFRGDVYK